MDSSFIEGYVSPATFQRPEGVEILKRSAQVAVVPYLEIRALYFVRDFEGPPPPDEKKLFSSRPKLDGLWVRLTFRDDEVIEGVMPNDLLQMGETGVTIAPPDANSNTQRVFVPRRAIRDLKVLSVIGSPVHRRRARAKAPAKDQIDLFAGQKPQASG